MVSTKRKELYHKILTAHMLTHVARNPGKLKSILTHTCTVHGENKHQSQFVPTKWTHKKTTLSNSHCKQYLNGTQTDHLECCYCVQINKSNHSILSTTYNYNKCGVSVVYTISATTQTILSEDTCNYMNPIITILQYVLQ